MRMQQHIAQVTGPSAAVVCVLLPAFGGPAQQQRSRAREVMSAGQTYAVFQDGQPIAAAVFREAGGITVLEAVAVSPAARGQGLGRQLVEYLAGLHETPRPIRLETDDDAVGFYRALGFKVQALPERWPGVRRYACELA